MSQFDVLNPKMDLYQKYFIEASAGCGKTFSIENAFVRLIIDPNRPLDVQKILVLTFTREATSELKARIRLALNQAKLHLEEGLPASFEYLREIQLGPEQAIKRAIEKLTDALTHFDLAQIFTIHKFCFLKMKQFLFQAELNLSQDFDDSQVNIKTYETIVRDFLSFYLEKEDLSTSQIHLLLRAYKNDFQLFLKSCVLQLSKETPIEEGVPFKTLYQRCLQEIKRLQKIQALNEEQFLQSYSHALSAYKGAANIKGEVHKDLEDALEKLSKLFNPGLTSEYFESALASYPTFKAIFQAKNLKKKVIEKPELYAVHFAFEKRLSKLLFPLLDQASSKENAFCMVCSKSYQLLLRYFEKNHLLTPQNILQKFRDLVKNPQIAGKISEETQAVIIDEFQDTDPLQWEILSTIFLENTSFHRPFYLVGDPKQSIYSFRRADIYTYLKAAQMLGVSQKMELNTNYRSQPQLLDALNNLFNKRGDAWLMLPKTKETLSYTPILSSQTVQKVDYGDKKGSIHFLIGEQKERAQTVPSKKVEETILFPFIVNEILRLHEQKNIAWDAFAILVRDRFQGARLKHFLKSYQLPFTSTRPESLQGLDSVKQFTQIFRAILHPKSIRELFSLKLNSILNFPQEIFEEEHLRLLIQHFLDLNTLLFEKGFLAFYDGLMNQATLLNSSIYEKILSSVDGIYLYSELEQIKDLMVQEELAGKTPMQLLKCLECLSEVNYLAEKTHPLRQNFEEVGIQILTLHMSKGLEFEIVFALGLVNQVKEKDLLILKEDSQKLSPTQSISPQELELYKNEQNAEKLRQLYVALTRAKQRLYIPCIFTDSAKDLSAMDLFLDKLQLDAQSLKKWIETQPEITATFCKGPLEVEHRLIQKSIDILPPEQSQLKFVKQTKNSFSSLLLSQKLAASNIQAPHDFLNEDKTIHTLPAGAATGSLFHDILEKIDFQDPEFSIDSCIVGTSFEPWQEVIRNQIERLLSVSIEGAFSLKNLEKEKTLKESEFLYPHPPSLQIEELVSKGNYLHGFIDLICLVSGKYYLIDYKTNWLPSYTASSLQQAMDAHYYFIQEKIYRQALKKILQHMDPRPFEECFGGSYYWFIRGLDESGQGLFKVN